VKNNPLIVALDSQNKKLLEDLVDQLAPIVTVFKVGYLPFLRFGWELVDFIQTKGCRAFLDLKFHDIPNTVANAVDIAANKGVFMLTLHTLGGMGMLKAAVDRSQKVSPKPLLLGVTLLTSMDETALRQVGIQGPLYQRVQLLANMAEESGIDGVVASPLEAADLRKTLGKDFIIVTPGVRPLETAPDDQKRVATPKEACDAGADYIVVGRPICQAEDPFSAAQAILRELER
jgi:orotidine-5'-phosphate decarboxylase